MPNARLPLLAEHCSSAGRGNALRPLACRSMGPSGAVAAQRALMAAMASVGTAMAVWRRLPFREAAECALRPMPLSMRVTP